MDVRLHTTIKHRMLGVYFKFVKATLKGRPLYYVDLYAGDGVIHCPENKDGFKTYAPPFIVSLLEPAKKEKLDIKVFLNDQDVNNFNSLEKIASKYPEPVCRVTNKDANAVVDDILPSIPATERCIFFLDPFSHSQLNWRTIEKISKHSLFDGKSRCLRKPELIINLMTYTMQRAANQSQEADEEITQALGTDDWKSRITEKMPDEKFYEIFLEIFTKRLESLGYEVTAFSVMQTKPSRSTMYYLVFASAILGANKIIQEKYKPYIDKVQARWEKETFEFRMISKAKAQGMRSLQEFTEVKK